MPPKRAPHVFDPNQRSLKDFFTPKPRDPLSSADRHPAQPKEEEDTSSAIFLRTDDGDHHFDVVDKVTLTPNISTRTLPWKKSVKSGLDIPLGPSLSYMEPTGTASAPVEAEHHLPLSDVPPYQSDHGLQADNLAIESASTDEPQSSSTHQPSPAALAAMQGVEPSTDASSSRGGSASTPKTIKQQLKFNLLPETTEETSKIEELCNRYRKSAKMAKDYRCLVKKLYYDHVWREEMTVKALLECDTYAGFGETEQKVVHAKLGQPMSVRDNKCLVRGAFKKTIKRAYDVGRIGTNCGDCQVRHEWLFPRGYLQATFLGLFPSPGTDTYLLDCLLGGCNVSHLCHNSACTDPFHINQEPALVSMGRKGCVARNSCGGHGNYPACRLSLRWENPIAEWKVVQAECLKEQQPVPSYQWRCSAGCKHHNSALYNTVRHWRPGCDHSGTCDRGGHFIRDDSIGVKFKTYTKSNKDNRAQSYVGGQEGRETRSNLHWNDDEDHDSDTRNDDASFISTRTRPHGGRAHSDLGIPLGPTTSRLNFSEKDLETCEDVTPDIRQGSHESDDDYLSNDTREESDS
ncbi:hypothetical protein LTR10_018592 [Elasticomyces elasticus]|uniref:Zinc-binding loop region of homing endonuclease domain-containing protein n=1 Tax=Exophiala sideris TaxID=1016849 RepID=A0ABR0IZW4_9EURO|nr:hypothetical protein LTR10_018592 [Elasticomyces elasticus]KAK5023232.1 hypothetical protein LTS07_009454 [Exophiala sideris]KAK5028604.1 hypothetical protein LTR13_009055 [Exophiala sideris]KAK5052982.1 hypothetical protein LTR69_009551 [Exophiala sideris]KAK5178722.1 hypothetical protein LTR44_008836 [Eurotiomycetes sp. CCFEE 6388]